MLKYPMHFEVRAESLPTSSATWTARANGDANQSLTLAIPPEFDGPGGGLSPEDIYALALQNCFVATFKVFAEKSRLQFSNLEAAGTLTVDRDEKGVPWMAGFNLKVSLDGVTQKDLARRLLDRVSKSCMIINSVKTACTFEFEVTGFEHHSGVAN